MRDGRIAGVGRVTGAAARTIDARRQGAGARLHRSAFALRLLAADRRQRREQDPPGRHDRSDRRERIGRAAEADRRARAGAISPATSRRSSAAKTAVNLLSYVGLGQVREFVMGNDERAPKTNELEQMSRLVADAMKQGAYGVSTGLIYSPNAYAKTDELDRAVAAGQRGRRPLRVAPALRRREAARGHRGSDRDRRARAHPGPRLPPQGDRREELRPDEGSDRAGRGGAEARRRVLRRSVSRTSPAAPASRRRFRRGRTKAAARSWPSG